MAPGRLDGQVAIVSGASRGLGRAYALALAAAGARVMALARTMDGDPQQPGNLANLAAIGRDLGYDITCIGCDVQDETQIRAVVAQTMARFGRIDMLVNNAVWGIHALPLDAVTADEWDGAFRINVQAPYHFIRDVAPHMTAGGGGAIINLTSAAAKPTLLGSLSHGFPAYGVSKAALERLTTYCAAELAPDNIAVNAISPGNVAYYIRNGAQPDPVFWGEPLIYLAQQRPNRTDDAGGGITGEIFHTYGFGRTWGPRPDAPPQWDADVRHILREAGLD